MRSQVQVLHRPPSLVGEAPLRRLNPFPPRPLWGERVQGEGGACSWRMNLRPQGGCGGTLVTLGSKGRVRRGRLAVSKSPPSVRLARAWPRSADSAGRPNQRLAFGGPPRTRPDVSIGPLWREPEVVGLNRPGSDTGADYSPSARRVGARPAFDAALDSGPRHLSLSLGDRALPLREWRRDFAYL